MNDNAKRREEFVETMRAYHAKVAEWMNSKKSIVTDDDYQKSNDYTEAVAFFRQFKQVDGVDYSAVVKYARELFDRYDKADRSLDEKADAVIKYLAGGSAFVTFGALASIKLDSFNSCLLGIVALVCLIPSLIQAGWAIFAAIDVRRPRSSATLQPIKFAVEMAEYYKEDKKIDINLWLIFHPICEAYHYRNTLKAVQLSTAHKYYQRAIACLLIPIIGVAIALAWVAYRISP